MKQNSAEGLANKIDIGFKSIHQQVQEENEKKQQALSQGSRKSLFPNLEIDEKLLNLLMPNESFNEGDFDYFQHFGTRRFEPSQAPHDPTKEDIKKYQDLRTKVVKTEDDKEPQVFVAKESTKAPKKNVHIYVKPVNKEQKEVAPAKAEKSEKPVAVEQKNKNVCLVSYSSEDEEADETPIKKIKQT